jgi:hypothetical protein
MTDQVIYLGVILHCILAMPLCCGKDLGIITQGGGLAIHFRGEAYSFVCFTGIVVESGAEKCSETALSLAADDVFAITGGMHSTPTSALEVMLC